MANIRPFPALRPADTLAHKIAALPYDVMTSDEAREIVKDNPYSFLHVDKAEIDLDKDIDLYSDEVYKKAKDNLQKMIDDGSLIKDSESFYYIYRLTRNGSMQNGLVACASIDDYLNNTIKKHEFTREDKERDRIRHVDTTNAQTGPIFLTYKHNDDMQELITSWQQSHAPIHDFISEDGISHSVWVIDCEKTVNTITSIFKEIPALYIADGHHRAASAVKVGQMRREESPDYTGDEPYNAFLSVIFPANELYIMDYNRLVKDLNGLSQDEFLSKLAPIFDIEEIIGNAEFAPTKSHQFGMYLNNKWYSITAKDSLLESDNPVEILDVAILQNNVLCPVLGIDDPRTDKRIDFVGGIRGIGELCKRVDSGDWTVAFSMYPTSMDELMNVADMGMVMPPKSTWFEPKLRSGLFINSLS